MSFIGIGNSGATSPLAYRRKRLGPDADDVLRQCLDTWDAAFLNDCSNRAKEKTVARERAVNHAQQFSHAMYGSDDIVQVCRINKNTGFVDRWRERAWAIDRVVAGLFEMSNPYQYDLRVYHPLRESCGKGFTGAVGSRSVWVNAVAKSIDEFKSQMQSIGLPLPSAVISVDAQSFGDAPVCWGYWRTNEVLTVADYQTIQSGLFMAVHGMPDRGGDEAELPLLGSTIRRTGSVIYDRESAEHSVAALADACADAISKARTTAPSSR